MTEERALKIGLNLQNIGYQVDDETLKKIKPFKDAIEAEILEEIEDDKQKADKIIEQICNDDFVVYDKELATFVIPTNRASEIVKAGGKE